MRRARAAALFVVAFVIGGLVGSVGHAMQRPGDLGPYDVAVTTFEEGCDFDLDGRSLVWTDPELGLGPELILFSDGDIGGSQGSDSRCPGDPAELIDMGARVHYPGDAVRVAAGAPFPLVVVVHGRQPYELPGFEGFDALSRLLASHGYVVASLDARSVLDATIKSWGEFVREHVRRFAARNATGSGSIFESRLDLSRVSLIGHSRGGEGVIAAWEWQRVDPDPGYAIRALVSFAPTNFFADSGNDPSVSPPGWEPTFNPRMRDVAFQIIQGSKDCDVRSFDGRVHYDRAADHRAPGETLKSLVYIHSANHNYFNEVWETQNGDDCDGTRKILSGTTARVVANSYIHAFLDTVVQAGTRWRPYLTGEKRSPVVGTRVVVDFQAPSSEFVAIDHFDDDNGLGVNSLGGSVQTQSMVYSISSGGFFFNTDPAERTMGYGEDSPAAHLRLSGESDGIFETSIPAGAHESIAVAEPEYFSFRFGQLVQPGIPAELVRPADISVEITDVSGTTSSLVRARRYMNNARPSKGRYADLIIVMSAVRIPLSAFRGIDPLSAISVRLRIRGALVPRPRPGRLPSPASTNRAAPWLVTRQRGRTDIVIDDLRFTR